MVHWGCIVTWFKVLFMGSSRRCSWRLWQWRREAITNDNKIVTDNGKFEEIYGNGTTYEWELKYRIWKILWRSKQYSNILYRRRNINSLKYSSNQTWSNKKQTYSRSNLNIWCCWLVCESSFKTTMITTN